MEQGAVSRGSLAVPPIPLVGPGSWWIFLGLETWLGLGSRNGPDSRRAPSSGFFLLGM